MKRCLLFLSFILSSPIFATEVLPVNQFSGLNTDESTLTLTEGQTPDSENVVTDLNGLQGRKGFTQFSTQTAQDIWQFPLSSGVRYIIKRSSNTLLADTGAGTFTTTVSTIPADRKTVATVLGDKFYFMNTLDGLQYWTGSSVVVASRTIAGTMISTHKGRLWVGGISGQERVLRISKYLDGTSWTAPTNASDDDAAIITIAGALDENVQAIYSSFQDKLIWFKKNSFGGIFGSRRSNFIQRTFSDTVGVAAIETIQDCDGYLRWLGNNRQVWEFDGATYYKISEKQNNLFSIVSQGDAATRSSILTTQGDWDLGTSTGVSTSISFGSVVLSTMEIIVTGDETSANFGLGNLTNLSTTGANSLILTPGPASVLAAFFPGADDSNCSNICLPSYYSSKRFLATSGALLSSVVVRLKKTGSPSDFIMRVMSDSAGLPGTSLETVTIPATDIGSSIASYAVNFSSTTRLISGTSYWVLIGPTGTCDSSNKIDWYGTGGFGGSPGPVACGTGLTVGAFPALAYEVITTSYPSSGNIVSRTFDIGVTTNTWLWQWSNLYSTATTPTGTSLSYQTQSSADGVSFDSLVSVANGSPITSTVRRYLRYKSIFSTTDGSTTPAVSSILMYTGPFLKPTGNYTSKLISIGNSISSWSPITIGNVIAGAATETFQVGSTSTANLSLINNWTTITNNSVPTISTNPYVAFRSTFSATSSTDSISLNDFTFSWTDGSVVRSASGYIDQRYWLSLASNTTTNKLIYVYDRKKQWQRYTGINADCLGLYNSGLYFGNSSGIFKTEEGYSDAGSNITSFFNTKDYAPSGFDIPTQFQYLYVTTDQSDGTLTNSFKIDASTNSYSMGSYQMNTDPQLQQNFKIPFYTSDVTSGKFLNLRFGVAGTSFWRVSNVNIYHDKGLVPQ